MEQLKKQELNELNKLKKWNEAYRLGEPMVSDAEYDAASDLWKAAHPNHDFSVKVEPAAVQDGRKRKLPVDMKSLDKVKSFAAFEKWSNKVGLLGSDRVAITPKFDGLSMLWDNYTGNAFSRGGNENEGQVCDEHFKLMDPLVKRTDGMRYYGGEVIISRNNWNTYWKGKQNPRTGDEYKTPRGVMAGLLRHDSPDEKMRYVDFFKYYCAELEYSNYTEMINRLNEENRVQVPICEVGISTIDTEFMSNLYFEWNKDYEIDGLVINVIDGSKRKQLGRDEKSGNPKYAIAYKANFEKKYQTTVREVNFKVSKQGFLKPTAKLDSVVIDGADIDNPTCYNAKWVFDNNIAPGSTVEIIRSGSVIPKITQTLSYDEEEVSRLADKIAICPSCGEPTAWNSSYVELCCTNPNCRGKKLAQIVAFFKLLGFEDFGEGTIEKLFNAGYCSISAILDLKWEDIISIDGLGTSTADTVINKIQTELFEVGFPLAKIMHASGLFPGLGSTKLQLFLDNSDLSEVDSMLTWDNTGESLTRVKGLSHKSIDTFFKNLPLFRAWWGDVCYVITISSVKSEIHVPTSYKYKEVCACFSGVRDKELEAEIADGGGSVVGSVSKKTTHLVVADVDAETSKIKKAKQLNCEIITLEDFKRK